MVRPWAKKKAKPDLTGLALRPIHDNLLVKIDPVSDFTGVIFIPGGVEEDKANVKGTVIAVGPGRMSQKTGEIVPVDDRLVEGVRVVVGKYAGTEIGIDGNEHRLMAAKEVLVILEDGSEEVEEPDSADDWKNTVPAEAMDPPTNR